MGRKQIKECLVLQLVTNIINIVLDLFFVKSLNMNVAGVAYATLISQIMTTLLSIYIIFRGKKGENFKIIEAVKKIDFKKIFDKEAAKQIIGVNFDLVIRTVCLLAVTNLFMEEASGEGEIVLAANSILFQIQYLMAYFFDGFANASSVFDGLLFHYPFMGESWALVFVYSAFGSKIDITAFIRKKNEKKSVFGNESVRICRPHTFGLNIKEIIIFNFFF